MISTSKPLFGYKKYLFYLLGFIAGTMTLMSCAKQTYYIDTRTEQSSEGEYLIKWDVKPGMKGNVAIYASTDAGLYPQDPFTIEEISKETTVYTPSQNGYKQTYFLLVFNDLESRVASSRVIPTQGLVNLRDVGGYMTGGGEQMRWGRLYRSGDLHRMGEMDKYTLASLGIQSQYILSQSRVSPEDPIPVLGISSLNSQYIAPDVDIDFQQILDDIYAGELSKSGVKLFHNDVFNSIAFENPNQISAILHTLMDRDIYPVLLSDDLGKDRVAFVVMLVQHILGVSRADILNDYVLSNQLLPVDLLEPNGHDAPITIQEALTDFFRCEANQMNAIISEIENRYGSINRYLEEFLRFDAKEQALLRSVLLY